MKKLFLFSALSLAFFAMSNVAFAGTKSKNIDHSQNDQRFEQLLKKVQEENLLSAKMKRKCENIFEEHINAKQINSPQLTSLQKGKINECIDAIYFEKFKVMEQKIEALRNIITKLKRLGKNTDVLEQNLEQAEGKLELLKESL